MFKAFLIVLFTGLSTVASAGTTCAPEAAKLIQCTTQNLNQIGDVSNVDSGALAKLIERQCGWEMRLVTLCAHLDESIANDIVQFQIAAFKANSTPSK